MGIAWGITSGMLLLSTRPLRSERCCFRGCSRLLQAWRGGVEKRAEWGRSHRHPGSCWILRNPVSYCGSVLEDSVVYSGSLLWN